MSRRRFALLLLAALLAITAAVLVATRRNSSAEIQGAALFPTLAANLDKVTALRIAKGSDTPTTTLEKSAGSWTLKERGGYPADITKLRKLLTDLGAAKIVETKTADAARYAVIGVEDPAQPGSTGTKIIVTTEGGTQAVIVGKAVGESNFVRRVGEQQSYSVEPGIPVEAEPHFWIDSRLLDVPVVKIQSIEYQRAGGAPYTVRRTTADGAFILEGAPAGRKAADAAALAPTPTTLSGLTAEDVSSSEGIDFSQPFVATLTLTDGEIITLTGAVAGAKHWVQVKSSKDAALTARAQGRAFEVASYRYDAIFKPLEQLLAPKEPPAGGALPGGRAPTAVTPHAANKN